MSQRRTGDYDTSYPTCLETYSTLLVFSDELSPAGITELLEIQPTKSFRKGEVHSSKKLQRKTNGWFYSTKEFCSSKDTREHINFVLAALDGKVDSVKALHLKQCKIDITSYWVSVGQGGPWLMPEQMLKLGKLGIEVWWDVYFGGKDNDTAVD
jgi:hypothetical protein